MSSSAEDLLNKSKLPATYGAQDHLRAPISKQQWAGEGGVVTDATTSISFHNVIYEIKLGSCFKGPATKNIINDISGILPQGLSAVMGPTGSGKTRFFLLL